MKENSSRRLSAFTRRWASRGQAAERVSLTPRSPWWGEHRSRYHFAARLVRGAAVGDIGCGDGYGASILRSAGASFVVGVELSQEALQKARAHLRRGLTLCQADAQLLPIQEDSLDVATCFETIEHLEDDRRFLREVRRVLRAGGLLVISTPQATPDRFDGDKPKNRFHLREYTPQQFRELLEGMFDDVRMFGQRPRDAYPLCPLWDPPKAVQKNPAHLRRFLWCLQHRLPFVVKDSWSRFFHNRAFYPGEFDFRFDSLQLEEAHVLVAVCRK